MKFSKKLEGNDVISIEMSDVIGVLQTCQKYLLALVILIVAVIAVMIAAKRVTEKKKRLIRGEAVMALLLGIVIIVNSIIFGPMYTIVSLSMGNGVVSDENTKEAEQIAEQVASEGFVLLQNNDNFLPLKDEKQLNLFGWAASNPIYGGTGSGGINDLYPIVSLVDGFSQAGYAVNQELLDFYTTYCADRASMSIEAQQNWDLPEPPVAEYTDDLLQGAKEYSDTAVIVIARQAGEGHTDIPQDMSTAQYADNATEYKDFEQGEHYLQLSQTEEDMVNLVCDNFSQVVVVYNSAYAFELGFVEEHPEIKSVVWAPGTGNIGFKALGKIFNGEINPSGKTNDTFVYDIDKAPYYHNAEKTDYANLLDMTVDGMNSGVATTYAPSFMNYVENIYVGYKFYETAATEGFIQYEDVVQYPFGYGLSYTSFEQEMSELSVQDGEISFDVTVTNKGAVAGKDVVEIYYNPPYENGGIEKASANLIDFEKTDLLAAGESQTLSFTIQEEEMASYDEKDAGAYVLEKGEYIISINGDSHTILAQRSYTVAQTIVYDEANPRSSDDVAATNLFQDAQGNVEYLSRADQFANYAEATAMPSDLNMPEEYVEGYHLNANYDPTAYIHPEDVMPVTGADNGLQLVDLRGKAYDDPMWEKLLDQLTVEEMSGMIALSGYQTPAIPSIGKVQNIDCDGPAAVNHNFTGAGSIGFPIEVVIACTWSKEIATSWGQCMGKMAKDMGATGWYAPGMNTHRSAFTARNYEYFSEDGVLAGKIAAAAVAGALNEGVYSTSKHFAMYDSNGKMVCAWATEQSMREIYLKPFEISVKEGGATGCMASWAFIGNKWVGELSTLMKNVLRDEWGFRGFVVSDFFRNNGHGFMNADTALANGVDAMLSTYAGGPNQVTDMSAASNVIYMREATHNILYTTANSWAYDEEHQGNAIETWKIIIYAIDAMVVIGILLGAIKIFYHFKRRKIEVDKE